jgi:HAD superfamily hydrolase (TIGR01662 family)
MIKNIKAIILDFDGTLGDTTEVITKTMQATIKELGLPCRSNAECAATIGLKLVEIPPALFPDTDIDPLTFASTYRRLFHIFNSDGAVKLYPNVPETLKELHSRGYILTIASSRSHTTLDKYISRLGLSDIITYVVGGEDVTAGKPDPEAVNMTLEKLGLKPDEVIVVGDTSFDIDMGRNAGTKTCGVSYGNGTKASLKSADRLIDNFSELISLI